MALHLPLPLAVLAAVLVIAATAPAPVPDALEYLRNLRCGEDKCKKKEDDCGCPKKKEDDCGCPKKEEDKCGGGCDDDDDDDDDDKGCGCGGRKSLRTLNLQLLSDRNTEEAFENRADPILSENRADTTLKQPLRTIPMSAAASLSNRYYLPGRRYYRRHLENSLPVLALRSHGKVMLQGDEVNRNGEWPYYG